MDGILNIYKEKGYTSFDVVAKLRGILHQKKIGHTGTLDPMAEGVLLVCLGKATKLVDMMTSKDKEYTAAMRLGITTDTEDITGNVISEGAVPASLTAEAIEKAVMSFVCEYDQLPPMYSAIKKDGKKLYEYAREGIAVERQKRPVKIYSIDIISLDKPDIKFNVRCSKGTYIRSLCRDIGESIGCGGVLTELTRNDVNGYGLDTALTLSQVQELADKGELDGHIIAMEDMLKHYDRLDVRNVAQKLLKNGNKLDGRSFVQNVDKITGSIYRVYCDNKFVALYEADEAGIFKPYKMFL